MVVSSSRRRIAGFSMVEGIVASVILAMAIAAMFAGWNYIDKGYYRTKEVVQAGQIGRAELERAKVYGVDNLPKGSYNTGTQLGTWTGSYITSTNTWTTNGTAYFDWTGNPLAAANTAGVKYSLQITITDSDVEPNLANTSYLFTVFSKRNAVVSVRRISDSVVLFTQGTTFVKSGI